MKELQQNPLEERVSKINSWLKDPPIGPVSASNGKALIPNFLNILRYIIDNPWF